MRNWFFCVFTLCVIVLATNFESEKITLKVDQLPALRRKKLNKRMVIPTLSKPDLVIGSTPSFNINSGIGMTGRTSSVILLSRQPLRRVRGEVRRGRGRGAGRQQPARGPLHRLPQLRRGAGAWLVYATFGCAVFVVSTRPRASLGTNMGRT